MDLKYLQQSYQGIVDKLVEFRNRYDRRGYPKKVVLNMFYDLHTLRVFWPYIDRSFVARDAPLTDIQNFLAALVLINKGFELFRLEQIRPVLNDLITKNIPIGSVKYSDIVDLIERAENGDDAALEEVEYTYIFMGS